MGLKGLRGREGVRLLVVAIVAAGVAVGIVEATGSSKSSTGTAGKTISIASGGTHTSAGSTAGSTSVRSGQAKVAGGAAVERSLRAGVITVAVDSPPPGLLSEQNKSIAQGASVAADELNSDGGLTSHHVHIKLVTQTLDGLSQSALKSRLLSEGAAALILPCDTDSEQSLAAAGAQFGMLMLAPCNPASLTGASYPTLWAVGASASQEATAMVSFMASDNFHRVFVVAPTGAAYGEEITSAFHGAAEAGGIKVIRSVPVAVTSTSFANVVQAFEAIRPLPAGLFTALPAPLISRVAAALAEKGLHPLVLGSTVMDTPVSLSGGGVLENANFVSYGFPRLDSAASRFASDFRAAYGKPPVGSFPGLGFEAIRLLAAAAGKGGSAAPGVMQRALAGGLTLQGVALASRSYQPGGNHNPVGEVGISKVYGRELLQVVAETP